MREYIHRWKNIETGEICKHGEGKIAESIDEAIKSYYQEEGCTAYEYYDTIELATFTFRLIDITEVIDEREWEELPDYAQKHHIEMQRGFDDAKYGE